MQNDPRKANFHRAKQSLRNDFRRAKQSSQGDIAGRNSLISEVYCTAVFRIPEISDTKKFHMRTSAARNSEGDVAGRELSQQTNHECRKAVPTQGDFAEQNNP